jgi:hypothetical protein
LLSPQPEGFAIKSGRTFCTVPVAAKLPRIHLSMEGGTPPLDRRHWPCDRRRYCRKHFLVYSSDLERSISRLHDIITIRAPAPMTLGCADAWYAGEHCSQTLGGFMRIPIRSLAVSLLTIARLPRRRFMAPSQIQPAPSLQTLRSPLSIRAPGSRALREPIARATTSFPTFTLVVPTLSPSQHRAFRTWFRRESFWT